MLPVMKEFRTARGRAMPLGATALADGVNFALLCRHGTGVRLVLLPPEGSETWEEIDLDPRKNRTGDHWHVLVSGLPPVFRYGWRVDGPSGGGHRFGSRILLSPPNSTALSDGTVWGCSPRPEPVELRDPSGRVLAQMFPRAGTRHSLFFRRAFDWREDAPPLTPLEDSIIYELHVRGFTCHPSARVAHPGTFAGLTEKIPYLKDLGVTAVELLPVHEFEENDCPFSNPWTGERLRN